MGGPSILYPKAEFKSPNKSKERKLGYSFKIGISHPVSKKIELNTNLLFERKGLKSSSISQDKINRITGDLTNDYLTISLMPRYIIGRKARLNADMGGYFSLLQKSKTTYVYDSAGIRKHYYSPTEPIYKRYDAGISLCLSYTFPLNENKSLIIQFLNSNGLVNIGRYYFPSILSISKNNSFSVLSGIRFIK